MIYKRFLVQFVDETHRYILEVYTPNLVQRFVNCERNVHANQLIYRERIRKTHLHTLTSIRIYIYIRIYTNVLAIINHSTRLFKDMSLLFPTTCLLAEAGQQYQKSIIFFFYRLENSCEQIRKKEKKGKRKKEKRTKGNGDSSLLESRITQTLVEQLDEYLGVLIQSAISQH